MQWIDPQTDVLTDTEMPDRQTDVLPQCPMFVQMDIQMYEHTQWTYRKHTDLLMDIQI